MLRITKQSDYGILLLTQIAGLFGTGTSLNAQYLAAATKVPTPMVSKILKSLAKAGLLSSQRGVKGGYALARPPADVNLADILVALEGPIALTECADHDHEGLCRIEGSCRVRVNWQKINDAVRGALQNITLAELAEAPCAHLAGVTCAQPEPHFVRV